MMPGQSLAVAGAYLATGTVLQASANLAASIVLARFLPPTAFGRFALVWGTIGLLFAFFWLRLEVLIIRARDQDLTLERRRVIFSILTIQAIGLTILSMLGLAFIAELSWWDVLLAMSMGLNAWATVTRAFFERRLLYRRLAFIETAVVTTSNALAMAAVVAGIGEPVLYLREAVTAVGLTLALYAGNALVFYRFTWPGVRDWSSVLREMRGIWADGALEIGFQRLVLVVAARMAGIQQAGLFFMAQSLAMRPNQIIHPVIVRMSSTWLGQNSDPAVRRRVRDRILLVLTPMLIFASGAIAIFADPVVPLVLGEHWRAAVPVIIGMSGVFVFTSLFEILRAYCLISRQARRLLISRIGQFLVFGLGISIMAVRFQVDAVQLALICSATAIGTFSLLWFQLRCEEKA